MQDTEIQVRDATPDDAGDLLEWRNDPITRKMSFDSAKVSRQAHLAWFSRTLKSQDRYLFIGEYAGMKIGMCRLDFNTAHSQAEISINMNPDCRGQGLAAAFLITAIQRYQRNNNVAILARTKACNLASQKAFKKAGFMEHKVEGETVHLLLPDNGSSA